MLVPTVGQTVRVYGSGEEYPQWEITGVVTSVEGTLPDYVTCYIGDYAFGTGGHLGDTWTDEMGRYLHVEAA